MAIGSLSRTPTIRGGVTNYIGRATLPEGYNNFAGDYRPPAPKPTSNYVAKRQAAGLGSEDLTISPRNMALPLDTLENRAGAFANDPYMVVNYGSEKNNPSYDKTLILDPARTYQLVNQLTGETFVSDPNDRTSLARLVGMANRLSGNAPTRASWDIMEGTPGEGGQVTWGSSLASDRPNRSFLNQMLPYLGLALGAVGTGGLLGLLGAPAAAGAGGLGAAASGIGAGIGSAASGLGAAGGALAAGGLGAGGLSALGSTAAGAAGTGLGVGGAAAGLGAGATGAGAGLGAAAGGLGAAGGAGGLGSLAGAAGGAASAMANPITVIGATGAGAGLGGLAPSLGGLGAGAAAIGSGIRGANPSPEQSWQDKLSKYLEYGGYATQLLGGLFGGGGGSGGAGTMPNTGLHPIFNAQLPAANLPGGNNIAPRQMPQQDWTQYAFGPEQSFFNNVPQGYAHGGDVRPGKGHSPHVTGPGTGRSDDIPAVLSDGEYVMDAETVAMLGDGSNKAGADRLDELRVNIRKHKAKKLAKGKMSHDAKRPEQYLTGGSV